MGPNPIARSNNKKRLLKGSLFLLLCAAGYGTTKKWVRPQVKAERKRGGNLKDYERSGGKANPIARSNNKKWEKVIIKKLIILA